MFDFHQIDCKKKRKLNWKFKKLVCIPKKPQCLNKFSTLPGKNFVWNNSYYRKNSLILFCFIVSKDRNNSTIWGFIHLNSMWNPFKFRCIISVLVLIVERWTSMRIKTEYVLQVMQPTELMEMVGEQLSLFSLTGFDWFKNNTKNNKQNERQWIKECCWYVTSIERSIR